MRVRLAPGNWLTLRRNARTALKPRPVRETVPVWPGQAFCTACRWRRRPETGMKGVCVMPESKSANVVGAIAVVGPTEPGKTALIKLWLLLLRVAREFPRRGWPIDRNSVHLNRLHGRPLRPHRCARRRRFPRRRGFCRLVGLAIVVADRSGQRPFWSSRSLKALEDANPARDFINKIDTARGRIRRHRSAAAGSTACWSRLANPDLGRRITGFVDLALEQRIDTSRASRQEHRH